MAPSQENEDKAKADDFEKFKELNKKIYNSYWSNYLISFVPKKEKAKVFQDTRPIQKQNKFDVLCYRILLKLEILRKAFGAYEAFPHFSPESNSSDVSVANTKTFTLMSYSNVQVGKAVDSKSQKTNIKDILFK